MDELDIKGSEICVVISTNESDKTFFVQFSKISLEELMEFNSQVDKICTTVHDSRGSPTEVKKDDLLCSKFSLDGRWYRAKVLSSDTSTGKCTVLYIDYGNKDTVSYSDLVKVDRGLMPKIGRAPIGITCSLSNSGGEREENLARMLKLLPDRYVMLKVLGQRKEEPIWDVEVAKHAFNMPIWEAYKPDLKERAFRSGHWKIVHA